VDASVYQSVFTMDDVFHDDDDDDDDDDVLVNNSDDPSSFFSDRNQLYTQQQQQQRQQHRTGQQQPSSWSQQHHNYPPPLATPPWTVKSILWTGMTISFGSMVHCGLLGGIAQWIWSQIRTVEYRNTATTTTTTTAHASSSTNMNNTGGFRGMSIAVSDYDHQRSNDVRLHIWDRMMEWARNFVRDHSTFAMTHVALYYKGYTRAARDVSAIIEASGTGGTCSVCRVV
jgi:hypothetical protein